MKKTENIHDVTPIDLMDMQTDSSDSEYTVLENIYDREKMNPRTCVLVTVSALIQGGC